MCMCVCVPKVLCVCKCDACWVCARPGVCVCDRRLCVCVSNLLCVCKSTHAVCVSDVLRLQMCVHVCMHAAVALRGGMLYQALCLFAWFAESGSEYGLGC